MRVLCALLLARHLLGYSASNISLDRNFAGIHWRSDYTESLRLGEKVAISLLFDQRRTCHEQFRFEFTRFDGTQVTIDKNITATQLRNWLA